MIEDTSVRLGGGGSWNDLSHAVIQQSRPTSSFSDQALIVYQNVDKKSAESEEMQLLMKAHIVLPAVMNYLYFSSAQVAVVYFGKRIKNKRKYGIREGAEDFKIRMIRFLTSEIWPPLLRTDAPDESLGADLLQLSSSMCAVTHLTAEERRNATEIAQEQSWFKKSVENNMQVLLYIKRGEEGTKYLKVILNNTFNRLHFDVIDSKEEKYRWDLRMLYTRIMDNLETQKAIDSYESYESSFRAACTMAAEHALDLERPHQALVPVTIYGVCGMSDEEDSYVVHSPCTAAPPPLAPRGELDTSSDGPRSSADDELSDPDDPSDKVGFTPNLSRPSMLDSIPPPDDLRLPRSSAGAAPHCSGGARLEHCPDRHYRWMESLEKPESATLDYKSYFSYPAHEIKHRCVKFMCGFLNAYRGGKLVIGVHEIPRRDPDGNLSSENNKGGGGKNIVVHNDLVDQFVVGVRITQEELEDVQLDVSQQLLECVPPIPPQTVCIDALPVHFPLELAYSRRILIFYEEGVYSPSRDSLKQKSNYAIRFLNPLGLSVIPLALVDQQLAPVLRSADVPVKDDTLKAEAYVVAAYRDPVNLTESAWEDLLTAALTAPKNSRCKHLFIDYPDALLGPLVLPPLYVVEVSVDIKRCGYMPLIQYQGKFFNGWPSIPIWDPATRSARRVERNYNIFSTSPLVGIVSPPSPLGGTTHHADNNNIQADGSLVNFGSATFNQYGRSGCKRMWYSTAQVAFSILAYLYSPTRVDDILQYRLVHPVWNSMFENRQGTHLVRMIHGTTFGVTPFIKPEFISIMQYEFRRAGVPPMPLLLCRVYEIIGNLPSPYPFVAVPLTQQSFRVSSFLIPIFYRQRYFDGTMRLAVVLDLRDGFLKTMELRDGNLVLETILGVCFEQMNKRQVARQLVFEEERRAQRASNAAAAANTAAGCGDDSERSPSPYARQPAATGNILATRRSLMPRALRRRQHTTGSRVSSAVLSPIISETTRLTQREVEPDIPLLHFRFLTREMVRNGTFVVDATLPPPTSSASPTSSSFESDEHTARDAISYANDTKRVWTLQHLLSWYNALFTDVHHVQSFGYCDRSVAYRIHSLAEVCADDLEGSALEQARQLNATFAECRHDCILHQRVRDWMQI